MLAARSGSYDTVNQLLKYGANIDDVTEDGKTALMIAVEEEHLQTATMLLDNGADVNAGMDDGYTPLMQAARVMNLEMVRLLLQHGASINDVTQGGKTALTIAVQKGNLQMATLFLDNNADVNAGSCTPLIQATRGWHLEIVGLLLERGASVDDVTEDGKTALMIAVEKGSPKMATLLLDNHADVNAGIDGGCISLAPYKNQELALLLHKHATLPPPRRSCCLF